MSAQVTILGNVGREVELRYTPQGTPVANFSIAANSFRNTPQGKEKKTDWFTISAYGKQGETLVKHLNKGDQILIRGDLRLSAWKTREGEPRVNADVTLQGFEFVGKSAKSATEEISETVTIEDEIKTEAVIPHDEETAEMLAALQEMESSDEAFAGQY